VKQEKATLQAELTSSRDQLAGKQSRITALLSELAIVRENSLKQVPSELSTQQLIKDESVTSERLHLLKI